MNNEQTKAIVRLVVSVVIIINGYLTAKGLNPLPFDETAVGEFITNLLAVISLVWVWWKNNNITTAACKAQELIKAIKCDGIDENEV